jgi:hypothetical protein
MAQRKRSIEIEDLFPRGSRKRTIDGSLPEEEDMSKGKPRLIASAAGRAVMR